MSPVAKLYNHVVEPIQYYICVNIKFVCHHHDMRSNAIMFCASSVLLYQRDSRELLIARVRFQYSVVALYARVLLLDMSANPSLIIINKIFSLYIYNMHIYTHNYTIKVTDDV